MKKPYLIFDFDGTLVDSFDCVVSTYNDLAQKFHTRQVTSEEAKFLRNLSVLEAIKFLEVPIYRIPQFMLHMQRNMYQHMYDLKPFAEIPDILQALHGAGYPLGILTSNARENVALWLEKNNLQNLFNFINPEIVSASKRRNLWHLLKFHGIAKDSAFYIGDEVRDIEAAHFCAMSSVAVTWGFQAESILAQKNPHHLLRAPLELLSLYGLQNYSKNTHE